MVEMMPELDVGRALPSERLLRRVGAAVLTAVASADDVLDEVEKRSMLSWSSQQRDA